MAIVPGSIQVLTKDVAWYTLNDPLLLLGQWGIESDDLLTVPKYKIGDGVTLWSALPYASSGAVAGLPAVLTVDPTTGANDIILSDDGSTIQTQAIRDPYSGNSYFIFTDNAGVSGVTIFAEDTLSLNALNLVSVNANLVDISSNVGTITLNSNSDVNILSGGIIILQNTTEIQSTLDAKQSITTGSNTGSLYDGRVIFENATNANTITLITGVTAGSYSLTLPTTDSTGTQALVSNGSGVLSWATVATSVSLTVGTTPITGGTASRILFEGAGNVVSESANLVWDNTNNQLSLLGAGTAALPTIGIGAVDLGFYMPVANEIAVTTGGSERFRFSSTYFRSPTTGGPNIRRAAGAVATPTYSFNGTVTTGMWLNGTFLDFSVGGVAAGGFSGSGVFKLYNAGGTFGYNITAASLAADRTLNIPLLTATDTFAMVDFAQTLTNKTMTGATNTLTASLLKSATTEVDVSAATAPSNGQVLTATSSTAATWQTPTGGGLSIGLSYSIARGFAMA